MGIITAVHNPIVQAINSGPIGAAIEFERVFFWVRTGSTSNANRFVYGALIGDSGVVDFNNKWIVFDQADDNLSVDSPPYFNFVDQYLYFKHGDKLYRCRADGSGLEVAPGLATEVAGPGDQNVCAGMAIDEDGAMYLAVRGDFSGLDQLKYDPINETTTHMFQISTNTGLSNRWWMDYHAGNEDLYACNKRAASGAENGFFRFKRNASSQGTTLKSVASMANGHSTCVDDQNDLLYVANGAGLVVAQNDLNGASGVSYPNIPSGSLTVSLAVDKVNRILYAYVEQSDDTYHIYSRDATDFASAWTLAYNGETIVRGGSGGCGIGLVASMFVP